MRVVDARFTPCLTGDLVAMADDAERGEGPVWFCATNGTWVATLDTETFSIGSVRLRPIRQKPVIRRLNDWHCYVVAPGAVWYEQGGVTRSIDNQFPCPLKALASHPEWGDGSRLIVVDYGDGETATVSEVWPTEVTR